MIKQSQDDGGDEITWKISPVNERLQAVSKRMPEMVKVLAESSRRNSLSIRQCSENNKACLLLSLIIESTCLVSLLCGELISVMKVSGVSCWDWKS